MIHDDILKPDARHDGILAAPASGLDAQSPVRVQEQAVLDMEVLHTARHLTPDRDRAVPVPHTALPDRDVLRRCSVFCPHIDLAGFDRDTVIAHRKMHTDDVDISAGFGI